MYPLKVLTIWKPVRWYKNSPILEFLLLFTHTHIHSLIIPLHIHIIDHNTHKIFKKNLPFRKKWGSFKSLYQSRAKIDLLLKLKENIDIFGFYFCSVNMAQVLYTLNMVLVHMHVEHGTGSYACWTWYRFIWILK